MAKDNILTDEEIKQVRFQAYCSEGVGLDKLGQYHLTDFTIKDLIMKVAKAQREATAREILEELEIVCRDYYQQPGVDFLEKYGTDEKRYWDGDNGEGIVDALKARYIPSK